MTAKLARKRAAHASTPFRLRRVRKMGNPICGLAMVTGSSKGKNALAAIIGDHCTVRIPAQ